MTDTLKLLNEQLLAAAQEFAEDARALSGMLARFVHDVERGMREPLEIFPVAHHSPASALHMVRRLQEQPPKVIFMEMCEDMLPLVENLRDCKLPVAMQAFAAESDTLPADLLPVMVVAPLTESSAEYQAIAYTLTHPETQLVFVDRAVDYVFQWDADWRKKVEKQEEHEEDERENAGLHGTAVGVTVGDLAPTFEEFLHFLLRNSNTRHFSEWWDQYVERSIISADYDTYRQVMMLIGSLMRHLGRRESDLEEDRLRERYMWTRMKQHLYRNNLKPQDAIYICGAAHIASEVEEFGSANGTLWEMPPVSSTNWLYGMIPSSYAAIEHQFNHPAGTISLAEGTWEKSLKASDLKAFNLKKATTPPRKKQTLSHAARNPRVLMSFFTQPPEYVTADHEQLLEWCVQIVSLARRNGYLASTADSIAIYETSFLLAQMRNRQHPSPYDFQDAAITCLEKDRTPKKRNIAHLCQILLGGDRVGTVGYTSLPPLAQNIYDRLAPLGIDLYSKTNQRALLDFKSRPELRDASDILWKLHYLLNGLATKPIVGERKLGFVPVQESWDVRIGKYQREVIQLGYEGVTIEQVLEQRMKAIAFDENATAARALRTAEDALLYMNSPRLVRELGLQAITLLKNETSAEDAPDIFQRARRLVHYYHTTPNGLPDWLETLVATGYTHYASLLPQAFADQGTTPDQIAGMMGFIFTLESLALALGCQRSQLLIGLQGAAREHITPDKLGLLWTGEWSLNLRTIGEMRTYFEDVLSDALRLPVLPQYLNGFILALNFAPGIARFVVELVSHVFGSLGDNTLIPWMPALILQLRQHHDILQPLIKEASALFPSNLTGFLNWKPAWLDSAPTVVQTQTVAFSEDEKRVRELLFTEQEVTNAVAAWLGVNPITWGSLDTASASNANEDAIKQLLLDHPETTTAVATFLSNN